MNSELSAAEHAAARAPGKAVWSSVAANPFVTVSINPLSEKKRVSKRSSRELRKERRKELPKEHPLSVTSSPLTTEAPIFGTMYKFHPFSLIRHALFRPVSFMGS